MSKTKQNIIKAWVVLAWIWDGEIKVPSVNILNTKKDVQKELKRLDDLLNPINGGERNKIVKVVVTIKK